MLLAGKRSVAALVAIGTVSVRRVALGQGWEVLVPDALMLTTRLYVIARSLANRKSAVPLRRFLKPSALRLSPAHSELGCNQVYSHRCLKFRNTQH